MTLSKKADRRRKKKRIVLGVGYPWYSNSTSTVHLDSAVNGYGDRIQLKIGATGAWKKYRLILEET